MPENTSYQAQVRATNAEGTGDWSASGSGMTAANNPTTGTPSISGTARVGQTLTAGRGNIADHDGLETLSYQWAADWGTMPETVSVKMRLMHT